MSVVEAICHPSPSAHVIFIRYVLFAVVSGLSNLATQEVVIRALPIAPIMVSVISGTGVGFFVKYLLDKRWVFLDVYDGHATEIRKICIYGVFGVATTLLFWGIELGCWSAFRTIEAKYFGAAIGLTLGNWIKYLLDKHYVFARDKQ
jgi:putative flippase GtrA